MCTFFYAHMVNIYYAWITKNKGGFIFLFLILGLSTSLYYIFRNNNGLAWFTFIGIVCYNVALPMLFVPGTHRMRVPIDPFLIIIYILGVFCVMRCVRYIAKTVISKEKASQCAE